jgi:hypothetical protein
VESGGKCQFNERAEKAKDMPNSQKAKEKYMIVRKSVEVIRVRLKGKRQTAHVDQTECIKKF